MSVSKRILTLWTMENLEQMVTALAEATEDARRLGHHPSTVYPNQHQMAMVEETLTDGSTVLNLTFGNNIYDERS